jgi:hypothetical protein
MQHLLEGMPPAAFTLQLAWEQRPTGEDIAATMAVMSQVVLCACPFPCTVERALLLMHATSACVMGRPTLKLSWLASCKCALTRAACA